MSTPTRADWKTESFTSFEEVEATAVRERKYQNGEERSVLLNF